ncbi:MAG TPA: alpha/beta hydrolase [Polyangiaceae bacterium]|nr:alpha/beta hydrolase [Polyangiaceae bacterium]
MSPPDVGWSFRTLLNPVVARMLIYGASPFDLERVLRRVEDTPLRNAQQLESLWLTEWEALAHQWRERSRDAAHRMRCSTARDTSFQASACGLAQFLINSAEISRKSQSYAAYSEDYRKAADYFGSRVLSLDIPFGEQASLPALLHLPDRNRPHPCVAIFAGLGSCKEEMNTLARFMVERGIAALVPDMPGSGASLFRESIVCSSENLSKAFRAVADFAHGSSEIDPEQFGAVGLCMGGGYAYRACFEDHRYRFCATLFPLFINQVADDATPRWMKSGTWYDYQTGGQAPQHFVSEVGWHDGFSIDCPFLMVHGKYDNWMTLERATILFEHARSPVRQMIVIDEEPVYASGNVITHTMPVGEQMGWVGPLVADWVREQVGG